MSAVTDYLRTHSKDAKLSQRSPNINPGAVYELEVTDIKGFKGFKSAAQGVIEFLVISTKNTEAEEVYKGRNKYPNQPGSSCGCAFDLTNDYKMGLFFTALSGIVGEPFEELIKPIEPGKETLTFETLMRLEGGKEPSICKGLRVYCEAYEGMSQKNQPVTKTRWTTIKPPAGHPLADAVGK